MTVLEGTPAAATERPALKEVLGDLLRGRVRDPLAVNPWLVLATTVLNAGFGAVFWVLAARMHSAAAVGVAGSLVVCGETLAVVGQLGVNVALARALPSSRRQAADVLVGTVVVAVGTAALAAAYVAVLPVVAPQLAAALTGPWPAVFVVLTALTAVNHLTDSVFLTVNRVLANLLVGGLLLGVVRVLLPLALVGAGALGLVAAVGLSAGVSAVLSLWVIHRALPRCTGWRPSAQLAAARRLATAGWAASVLYLVPMLVFPLVVVATLGAAANAVYFVAFQVVALLNALVWAFGNAMYAEGERHPDQVVATVRRAGRMLAMATTAGVVVLVVAAPLLLAVFGSTYAEQGTATLRVLALGSLGVAASYWSAMRLRLSGHRGAMVGVQLVTTVAMTVAAVLLAGRGTEWVAACWGLGQLLGGVVGYAVSRTVAPLRDRPAVATA